MKIKQCLKQTTVAVIMKDGKFISIGFNEILANNITECPRKDLPTGVGYEKCTDICHQYGHAEVNACNESDCDDGCEGATLYLIGHTYCCDNCLNVMKEHGIKTVVLCESGKRIEL